MTIGSALIRAGCIGAIPGLGGELFTEGKYKGAILLISTVASVALRAIAYYTTVGTAVGCALGGFVFSLVIEPPPRNLSDFLMQLTSGAMIGGPLGYVIGCLI